MPGPNEIIRRKGDTGAILEGLMSKSPLFRFQVICGAVNHSTYDPEIIKRIAALTDDGERIMGYSISALATAALAKAGAAKYEGDDRQIRELISAPVWFDVAK